MIYPLIPLFVVCVLGTSVTTLGGIEGGAQLLIALMTAWVGLRSDHVHRRVPYIRFGYGLPVVGKSILAIATIWPVVLVGRLIDRFGKGLRASPRDALIAGVTDPAIRGRAFGFHRAMDTAGALVGVLLAALLLWWLGGSPTREGADAPSLKTSATAFRTVFAISATLGLISLAITFLVREPEQPTNKPVAPRTPTGKLGLPPSYWQALAPLLVFALANSSDTFILLRARDLGLSAWQVVLAYALYNAVYALLSYPAGKFSDRRGRWRIILVGWAIYAAVYAGLSFTNAIGLWPLLALYGAYTALTDGVGKALVADHAPRDKHGTALGIYYMASGIAAMLASVAAGVLWDLVGPGAAFALGAAGAIVAIVVALLLKPRAPAALRA